MSSARRGQQGRPRSAPGWVMVRWTWPLLLAVLGACSAGTPEAPAMPVPSPPAASRAASSAPPSPQAASPPSTTPSAPPESPEPAAPPREFAIRAQVAVSALPTLRPSLLRQKAPYRVVDGNVHLDVVVPQLSGAPVLNERLRDIADTYVRSFRRSVQKVDGKGRLRYHAMTIGWQLVGRSPQTTGIQLWVAQQHGQRISIDRATVWYARGGERLLTLPDLVTPGEWPAVTAAIAGVLERGPYGSAQARAARAALSADEAPEGKAPTFGFAANGDLVVTFAPRVLWSRAEPVSVTLAGGALGPRLSGAGLAARGAAQANRVRAVAPAPPNCAREKCVALTFDDGPGSFTAELVELLQRRKVPATFFLVGNRVQLGPDLAQLLDSAGMEVGNHSSSHKELPNLATPELGRDLRQASEVLAAVTGRRPTLLRPPYGSRNVAVDRASKELGMSVILWDVDTLDWRYPDAARARSAAVNPARRGSIILLHDVHRTSVAAVPGIIEDLQRRGFTLVTVSQLIGGQTEPGQVYRQQPAPR